MNTNHGQESGEERNPSVKYDKSDLGARGILIFFLVLLVGGVVVHLGVLGLYVGMTKIADRHVPETNPLAPKTVTPRAGILTNTADVNIEQFPQPRLLHDIGDQEEMTKFLLQETATLTAKPWQDAQGNVHLPIEQAMKVVVTRLPVRTGTVESPDVQKAPGAEQPTAPDEGAIGAIEQSMAVPGEADHSPAGQRTGGAAVATALRGQTIGDGR